MADWRESITLSHHYTGAYIFIALNAIFAMKFDEQMYLKNILFKLIFLKSKKKIT